MRTTKWNSFRGLRGARGEEGKLTHLHINQKEVTSMKKGYKTTSLLMDFWRSLFANYPKLVVKRAKFFQSLSHNLKLVRRVKKKCISIKIFRNK